ATGGPPDEGHVEGGSEYDTDYRSAVDYNRGARDGGYGYEGGDHYAADDYGRGPPKDDYRSPREDFKNPRVDYGAVPGPTSDEYARDDQDSYARGRGDYDNRGMPPYDNYSRGMPPRGDDYPRVSRFDRPPDDRIPERGPNDNYGAPAYNGNGMGSNSSALNSSAAAVANKIGAKTRIIHPDDHQTMSLVSFFGQRQLTRGEFASWLDGH
ncbi:unnamed protein product, partial [Cylicostephanus goldi]